MIDRVGSFCQAHGLTDRESEVVRHLSDGLSSKEIADKMGVVPNTIRAFMRLIMIKTDTVSRGHVLSKIIHFGEDTHA